MKWKLHNVHTHFLGTLFFSHRWYVLNMISSRPLSFFFTSRSNPSQSQQVPSLWGTKENCFTLLLGGFVTLIIFAIICYNSTVILFYNHSFPSWSIIWCLFKTTLLIWVRPCTLCCFLKCSWFGFLDYFRKAINLPTGYTRHCNFFLTV